MKKLIYLIVVIVALGLIVSGCLPVVPPIEQGNTDNLTKGTITVSPGESIQAAIDAASPGDTITVAAGTYYEGLAINKPLTLEGENRDTTVIDGTGVPYGVETHYDYGICITAQSGVTISGFTVQNFRIVDTRGGNPAGVFFKPVPTQTGMKVSNLIIKDNLEVGMRIGVGPGVVSDSEFSDIVLENNNNEAGTPWTRMGIGLRLSYSSNNVFTDITINGHLGGGILIWDNSNGNSFTNIDCSRNRVGIYFADSSRNTVVNSVINHNGNGISLWASGMPGYECNDNEIHFSNITDNDYGIKNYNAGIVDAINNWWGDASGPSGGVFDPMTGTLANGTGDSVSTNVLFDPWLVPPEPLEVEIDIKPGSDPNSINLSSRGVVPVAVLTTDGFNANDVDPDTVSFAGALPVRWVECDVDDDGDMDLLFHFKTQELELDKDSIEATLTGETYGGNPIEGTDTVNIVPKK